MNIVCCTAKLILVRQRLSFFKLKSVVVNNFRAVVNLIPLLLFNHVRHIDVHRHTTIITNETIINSSVAIVKAVQ